MTDLETDGLDQAITGGGPYLLVEDVAERLRCSTRTVHELTRTNAIPHRRLPGSRRCLFRSRGARGLGERHAARGHQPPAAAAS